ncbi:hypothetical protein PG988_001329 [Apiospora saccharicola]
MPPPPTSSPRVPPTPYRQIRALQDDDVEAVTVYQAYNAEIASQAVAQQRLDASPRFRTTRMTWIKPSWCWMMYRAGYSYKDPNQARILALRMRREHFLELLKRGVLSHGAHRGSSKGEEGSNETAAEEEVRIQWDPERSARLEKLEYRSIQIGVPAALQSRWVKEWIMSIEDVTERARELKRVLDEEDGLGGAVADEVLVDRGLLPHETELVIPQDLQEVLGMIH